MKYLSVNFCPLWVNGFLMPYLGDKILKKFSFSGNSAFVRFDLRFLKPSLLQHLFQLTR